MEVTKSNFKSLLPEIEKDIAGCSFMAIDGEFTGLSTGPKVIPFDTPSQYYARLKNTALDFLFVQFGLSVFTQSDDFKRFHNKTYYFYLFPTPMNRDAPDCRFLCQASSLSFLADNGFDFNKLIREGIPYLKKSDEESLRDTLVEKRRQKEASNSGSPIPVPSNVKKLVDDAMTKIQSLLSPECKENEVRVEKCSAFVRKLIYQTVAQKLSGSGIVVETKSGVLVARKPGNDDSINEENKKEEDMKAAIGFVTIVKYIIDSGKLIVGHNLLLDLCHIVHRFVDSAPDSYLEFKEVLHSLFPRILDTKFMSSQEPLNELISSTFLGGLCETISKEPFKIPEIEESDGYTFRMSDQKQHNAGYDAFVTGQCFLAMISYLDSNLTERPLADSKILNGYSNKLFLMRNHDLHIDLEGNDPEPSRDHVFHVTFPKHWTSQQIAELFSPYGSVQISWLSDNTAWVGLHEKTEAIRVVAKLEDTPDGSRRLTGVSVRSYKRYMAQSAVGLTASSPRPNKRKRSDGSNNGTTMVNISPETQSTPGIKTRNKKKRRSSSIEPTVETIMEETEDPVSKEKVVSQLETAASEGKSAATAFPTDENWT